MKIRVLAALAVLFVFLPSCVHRLPPLPGAEVPAGPLVRSLEQRRRDFRGFKAVARVTARRGEKKRVFESVAILQQRFDKLRIEAYGLLGEPLFTFLWDGGALYVRRSGDDGFRQAGTWAVEHLLGFSLPPAELAGVLTGNGPAISDADAIRAACYPDGRCVVEVQKADVRWRIRLSPPAPASGEPAGSAGDRFVESCERYQDDVLAYRCRYEHTQQAEGYPFPGTVTIGNERKGLSLTVSYEQADVNVPVADSAFALPEGGDSP